MADAGAHGQVFSEEDDVHNSYKESGILKDLIIHCAKNQISIIGYKIGEGPGLSFKKCKEIFDQNKDESSYYNILEFPIEMFDDIDVGHAVGDSYKDISKRVTRDITKSTKAYIHFSSSLNPRK